MPIYKIESTSETNPKFRLVSAANKAQAIAHVAGKLFTAEACDAEEVAVMFVEHGIKSVEKAGNGNE